MPDIHLSAQLVSALPPVAAARGVPTDPAAPEGTPDTFAALLAGKLAPRDAAMDAAQLLKAAATRKTSSPSITDNPDALPAVAAETPVDLLAGKDAPGTKDSKDSNDAAAAPLPGPPDATAQLLASLAALTPAAPPAPSTITAVTPAESDTKGVALSAGRSAADAGKPATALRGDNPEETPARSQEHDGTPIAAAASAGPAHAAAAELPATPVPQPAAPAIQPSAQQALPATAPAPAVHMTVPGPIGTPLWREEFAASVSLLATQRVSSAELRVQPAEMGPVQVSIRIVGGEANIACAAQHADTRHALETALPRLREMLESNGISVGSASVGTNPQNGGLGGDAWGGQQAQAPSGRILEAQPADTPAFLAAQSSRAYARSDRLLDVFA
jgi:flagellar hook-length control protein FliK